MIESLTAVAWAFSTVGEIAQSEPGKKFIEATFFSEFLTSRPSVVKS
jgi:hypothetical protein